MYVFRLIYILIIFIVFQKTGIAQNVFCYGVASGDPQPESVIIWTALKAPADSNDVWIEYVVAEDTTFTKPVKAGKVQTGVNKNFTVSEEVSNLKPGTTYYYSFMCEGYHSAIGRTKTLPAKNDRRPVKLVFASCSNWQTGYFNAYGAIAQEQDVQAVVHLGDYIYEYGAGRYADSNLNDRNHLPVHEIVSLQDYRERYAQYRTDSNLQEMHRLHPVIVVWDDHELANNTFKGGAQNHQPETEGDWDARFGAAAQAYTEWLPIKVNKDGSIYRKFSIGEMADLIMIDTRVEGRTEQAKNMQDSSYTSQNRTILGAPQKQWVKDQLSASKATWKILGNQVVMGGLDVSHITPNNPKYMDMWDGYPIERKEMLSFIRNSKINNVLVATGDFHSSLGMELTENPHDSLYKTDANTMSIGTEFVVHSISAPNYDEYMPVQRAEEIAVKYKDTEHNPHVKHANLWDHGYVTLTLQNQDAQIEWIYMENIKQENNLKIGSRVKGIVANGTGELKMK